MRVRSFTRTAVSREDMDAIRALDLTGSVVIFEPWPGRYRVQFKPDGMDRVVGTGRSVLDAMASITRQVGA